MDSNSGAGNLVRQLSAPLAQSKGWIRLLAVVMIVYGVLAALTLVGIVVAWLPIWLGVLLWQIATAADDAQVTGQAETLLLALKKLKLYFIINGVLLLLGIVGTLAMTLLGIGAGMMGAGMPMH